VFVLVLVLHLASLLLVSPVLLGVIAKTKALVAGRRGPPLLQTYFDLLRLYRKGMVLGAPTTWIFLAGPVVGLVTSLLAGLMVPLGAAPAPVAFAGDLVLFAYLLGLGRFFTLLSALDTGSSFEGMGAAREATFSCLTEPALFLALLVLVRRAGALSLSAILGAPVEVAWSAASAVLMLVFLSLFIVLLAENCRIPFDDPNTHLELTMIHEVMVLDHSGPALGLVLHGAAIKLFVLGAVVVHTVLPATGTHAVLGWLGFLAAMVGLAVAIGGVESVMARLRLTRVPSLLVAACVLAGFGVVLCAR
jgi:formate hydrogenlyase subunit 4